LSYVATIRELHDDAEEAFVVEVGILISDNVRMLQRVEDPDLSQGLGTLSFRHIQGIHLFQDVLTTTAAENHRGHSKECIHDHQRGLVMATSVLVGLIGDGYG